MEIPKIYFVVFTKNGEIEILNNLKTLYRKDIHFILRRTFIKKSGGKRLHSYFRNEILDKNQINIENNKFIWGELKCELSEEEYYGNYQYFLDKTDLKSICLNIKVVDLLGKEGMLSFNTHYFNQVTKQYELKSKIIYLRIKEDLDLLNKVGTYSGFICIKKLLFKIENLKNKK